MRSIHYIVIHCSATPSWMNVDAKDIDDWHKKRGWSGIGYHFVIKREGNVQSGRPLAKVGAHVKGYNRNSLGVCLIGGVDGYNKPEDNFTSDQLENLRQMLFYMTRMFPHAKVVGHNQLDSYKDCPCFELTRIPGWHNHFSQWDNRP